MSRTWLSRRALAPVVVACLSAAAFAEVGDLEYAKAPPPFDPGVFVPCGPAKKIEQADRLERLGAVEAVVGEGNAGGTGKGIKVSAMAIRTKADTHEFDAVVVDLTGRGDFDGALRLALTKHYKTSTYYYASMEPGQGVVKVDGRGIPVTVTGYYHFSRGAAWIWLTLSAAAEGTCAFGKELRKVRVLDTVGDLRFGGPPESPVKPASNNVTTGELVPDGPAALRKDDTVQVADAQGRLDDVRICAGTMLGHPVRVAGKWYVVKVVDMKVSAEPLKAPMGRIAGIGEDQQLQLTGGKYQIVVNGAEGVVPVPADTYRVTRWIYFRPDKRGKAVPAVSSYQYPPETLEVAEGETAKVEMGLPIQATITATATADGVKLSLKRKDAAGHRILFVMNAAGKRPEAPAIEVVGKAGKVAYTARLEYG